MEARTVRNVKNGKAYESLFPKPNRTDPIVKTDASVMDTVAMVKKVVKTTLRDTARIAQVLKGRNRKETCANIWQFVYDHIRYTRDKPGVEQVRRPARSWADRFAGVDCDCYTTFISSILTNLRIPHTLRITEYASKGYFQHIYPIVPLDGKSISASPGRGSYLVLDCVKDAFDDEEPFTNHKDFPMEMQYLDGLGNTGGTSGLLGLDDYVIDGLGKVRRRKGKKVEAAPVNPAAPEQPTAPLVTPSVATATVPATMTFNTGVLKDGRKVELGEEVSGNEWTNPYSGSAQGKVFKNRKLLVNGAWDGKSVLMRFIVKDGVLRGVNTLGFYYADYSNGRGLHRIGGVNIKNPGVPLGALGGLDGGLDALYSIHGTGEIGSAPVPSRMGLFIPYSMLVTLWQNRNKGTMGLNGLAALEGLLGSTGLATLETEVMGLGDFEGGGRDDINGLAGDGDLEVLGIEALDGLGAYFSTNSYGDTLAVMDGLGRVRRASVRSRRGRGGAPEQAAPVVPTAVPASPTGEKRLGLYVPINTLRNLFKLRSASLIRLQNNGHRVSNGEVPNSVDGLAMGNLVQTGYESADGLGWGFFNDIAKGISNAVSSVVNVAAPVASFVPGLAPVASLAKAGSGLLQKITGNEQSGGQPQPQAQPQQVAPSAPAAPDFFAENEAESADAYNRSMSSADGLGNIPGVSQVVDFVKKNPMISIAGAGAIGYGIYSMWPKGKSDRYKSDGYSRKRKSGSRKSGGKRKSRSGKVQRFQMVGFS